jgi:hypothetical protein
LPPGNYKLRVVASNPHTQSNEVDIVIKDCITSVKEEEPTAAFSIYPNPVNDNFTIETNLQGNKIIRIKNNLGAEVYSASGTNFKFQISNLKLLTGIYFVEVETEKEKLVKKMIVTQ